MGDRSDGGGHDGRGAHLSVFGDHRVSYIIWHLIIAALTRCVQCFKVCVWTAQRKRVYAEMQEQIDLDYSSQRTFYDCLTV